MRRMLTRPRLALGCATLLGGLPYCRASESLVFAIWTEPRATLDRDRRTTSSSIRASSRCSAVNRLAAHIRSRRLTAAHIRSRRSSVRAWAVLFRGQGSGEELSIMDILDVNPLTGEMLSF